MKFLRILCVVPVLALHGCFVFYIPPSVINAASDSLSGAEGEHCVDSRAKVGDSITLPNGSVWKVASLSGTSSRCQNPTLPIRAKLTPV